MAEHYVMALLVLSLLLLGCNDKTGLECSPKPPGAQVGNALHNYIDDSHELFDCEGRPVKLSDFCGGKGTWLSFAHEEDKESQALAGLVEELHDSNAGRGLRSLHILVEPAPNAGRCRVWSTTYGLSDVITLYDPTGKIYQRLAEEGGSLLNVFLDSDRIIIGKIHTNDKTTLQSELERILK